MTQISFYKNGTVEFIKEWPNWSGEVPAVGDVVVLHYGDNNEEERTYTVQLRVIDGTKPDRVKIYIEELKLETERLSFQYNPALDIKIEDCKADLCVITMAKCRRIGIKTLGDLTRLHKADFFKYRHGGKKTVGELEDLLTKYGLTFAK